MYIYIYTCVYVYMYILCVYEDDAQEAPLGAMRSVPTREVLNDDLQYGPLLLVVGELVAGRIGDSFVGGLKTFHCISEEALEMQKFLMVTAILLVLLIQGLLPTELPSAARTFSRRGRDDLSGSVWTALDATK